MNYIKRKEILAVIFFLFIGFVLRIYTFDRKSLWIDEIHTFNDSRDDFNGQVKFYKMNPVYLHPPLFYILTHFFYPFEKPERDLRIIPLIFGTLSIPMIYLLAKQFSPAIALPCALSLTFMTYHIGLSQDGRSYSMLMFLGMAGLHFFIKHLKTSKKRYLLLVALFFSALFYTSYSSIPFIVLSQILWFYRPYNKSERPTLSSFLSFNALIFFFCLPWVLFLALNYRGQPLIHHYEFKTFLSFWNIFYQVFSDWLPHSPLLIVTFLVITSSLALSKFPRNKLLLLAIIILPVGGFFLFCKLFKITHFITSKYFINFLPFLLIFLFLSAYSLEDKLSRARRFLRFKMLILLIFIASNLTILPLYYRSEKQNFRDLVTFLKTHLHKGDKIIDLERMSILGLLHYFGAVPEGRHFTLDSMKVTAKEIKYRKSFLYKNQKFTIYHSTNCCDQYVNNGSRIWIVTSKWGAKKIKKELPCVLKGYFDASFSNIDKFPTDASIYLFLWDPKAPGEKGIDMSID